MISLPHDRVVGWARRQAGVERAPAHRAVVPARDTLAGMAHDEAAAAGGLVAPPPLPRALVDVRPLVIAGTVAWFVAFGVLAVLRWGLHEPATEWLWICLAGGALGLVGLGIVTWQRSAFRHHARGAQRMY
jgi:hypothetical protein